MEHLEQFAHIVEVQAGGRSSRIVERVAGGAAAEFRGNCTWHRNYRSRIRRMREVWLSRCGMVAVSVGGYLRASTARPALSELGVIARVTVFFTPKNSIYFAHKLAYLRLVVDHE